MRFCAEDFEVVINDFETVLNTFEEVKYSDRDFSERPKRDELINEFKG